MISLLRHASIRRTLMLIIMTISMISIVLTTLSISIINYQRLRSDMEQEFQSAVSIVGDRNKALLAYTSIPNRYLIRKAFENLNVFTDNPAIKKACLYDHDGGLLAFYDKETTGYAKLATSNLSDDEFNLMVSPALEQYREICPKSPQSGKHFTEDSYRITHLIESEGELNNPFVDVQDKAPQAGYLYVEAGLEKINSYMKSQMYLAMMITAGAVCVCYMLAWVLQHGISSPILRLSNAAQAVSAYKDYSIRVAHGKADRYAKEISGLIDAFNDMLSEIQDREAQLVSKTIELERAKEEAEAASIAKSQFLAVISHELRTPLNAIIGFSSIILNKIFGPLGNNKYEDYAKDIHDSGKHLLDIINDILDLSKAEAGKMTLAFEEFDIKKAINKCINILSEQSKANHVDVTFLMPEEAPWIVADRVRFIQIVLNILSNAVKFTEPGGKVVITVDYHKPEGQLPRFTVEIKDTGIGMAEEDLETAFTVFGQVDSGLDRKYEGTGLGLPLTKKLVELHRGSIRIESMPNIGTTVTMVFLSDHSLLK